MEDELDDKIIYQTYVSHMKFLSKLAWGGLPLNLSPVTLTAYTWRMFRLYCLRPEILLLGTLLLVMIMYLQTVDVWTRNIIGKLQLNLGGSRKDSRLSSLFSGDVEKSSWEMKMGPISGYAVQGRRPKMEDRFVINDNINGTNVALFAVFDGHGGEFAANYAKEKLINNLYNKVVEIKDLISGNVDYGKLITDEVLAADQLLVEAAKKTMDVAGTTALIAILEGAKLVVANVGDSRGVMCDGRGNAIPLSFDHKPQQVRERKRIKEAGGFVTFNGVWRVAGILATSRAMGDYPLKDKKLVIADPDILTFDLTDHKPLFLVLASDGLWDTFSNEEAVAFIKERLHESDFGAKSLTLQSYYRGSLDNITVLVVKFEEGTFSAQKSG